MIEEFDVPAKITSWHCFDGVRQAHGQSSDVTHVRLADVSDEEAAERLGCVCSEREHTVEERAG